MSGTPRKWIARPYRDGDEEGILELWKAVYPDRRYVREDWLAWWRWMYRDNPAGRGVIALADHDGKIIAHTAEIPMMMKIGDADVLAAIGLDAMTHPDYRRQGTYAATVELRRQESQKRGIRAEYAFRSKYSYAYPGLSGKVGMFDAATLPKVFRPLDWRATLKTQTGNKLVLAFGPTAGGLAAAVALRPAGTRLPEGMTLSQADRFDERFDQLWSRVSVRYRAALSRKKEYLNWRYVAVPDRHYTILTSGRPDTISGYVVFSCADADGTVTGLIAEVVAESQSVEECLIRAAVQRCREGKAALVWGARLAGTPLAAAYKRQGFIAAPRSKTKLVTACAFSPELDAELRKPDAWFLQMGDSDEA